MSRSLATAGNSGYRRSVAAPKAARGESFVCCTTCSESPPILLDAVVVAGAILEWFRPPFPVGTLDLPWIAAGADVNRPPAQVRMLICPPVSPDAE